MCANIVLLAAVLKEVHSILEALNKPPKSPPPPTVSLTNVAVCTAIPNCDGKVESIRQKTSQQQKNSGGTNTQQQSNGNNSPNISAPNGIAIGGGNVANPTINTLAHHSAS
jgi:hypothetical protein